MTERVKAKCCFPNSRRFQFSITSKKIGTSITHLSIRSFIIYSNNFRDSDWSKTNA